LVTDAVREHAYFSKQQEGYPWFFDARQSQFHIGQHSDVGALDFYESLSCIPQIHAGLAQSFE